MIWLVLLGLIVGIVSSFLGIGGGIIIVPTLYYLFPALPVQGAIGTSLAIIFLNSLINVYNFYKIGKRPQISLATSLGIGLIIGILIGNEVSLMLNQIVLKKIFGVFLFVMAFKLLLGKKSDSVQEHIPLTNKLEIIKLGCFSIFGGLIAGITGLGGGIIIVPLLLSSKKVPFSWISSYSNWAMAMGTLVGIIRLSSEQIEFIQAPMPSELMPFQVGLINFGAAALVATGSFVSSRFGAKLTQIIDQKTAKRAFAILLIVIGSRILLSKFS